MNISPRLNAFLRDMEFPATKDDLVREAERDGLSLKDQAVIRDLPAHNFNARWEIGYLVEGRAELVGAASAA